MYCQAYYKTLDLVFEEVERRFQQSQSDIYIIKEIEILLLTASNGDVIDTLPDVILNFFEE